MEWRKITSDWFGKSHDFAPAYKLSDEGKIYNFEVEVDKNPVLHPDALEYSWQEGLWDYDVAEIFFGLQNDSYIEFNLAPNGAFWAQKFNSYRVRDEEFRFLQNDFASSYEIRNSAWKTSLKIPKDLLQEQPVSVHVSFILYNPEANYFSSCPAPGEPDFHKRERFLELSNLW